MLRTSSYNPEVIFANVSVANDLLVTRTIRMSLLLFSGVTTPLRLQ
jgi:hypothetical protein